MSTAPLTILRKDYLAIVDQLIVESQITVSKAVRFCAAKLLNIFERFSTWKQNTYSLPLDKCLFWIPIFRKEQPQSAEQQTLPLGDIETSNAPRSLYDELNGEHCRESISKAVQLLKSLGLIEIQHNPYNGQDRTYWYRIFVDKLTQVVQPKSPPVEAEAPAPAPEPVQLEQGEILEQLRSLKIDSNGSVKKTMAKHSDRVPAAIDYVAEQQQQWAVRNPTGLFIKALNKGYKPSPNFQRPQPQQPTANSAYHDPTKFWSFLDSANARFQREGLETLVVWLNSLWQENAQALVQYLIQGGQPTWASRVEINHDEGLVEVAF